jgi:hypothetical protein
LVLLLTELERFHVMEGTEWVTALVWEAEIAWVALETDTPLHTIEVVTKRVEMNVDTVEGVVTIDPLQFTGRREAGTGTGRGYGNSVERSPDTIRGVGPHLRYTTMTGGEEEVEEGWEDHTMTGAWLL